MKQALDRAQALGRHLRAPHVSSRRSQSCQRVFDDFADGAGQPLRVNLQATGKQPGDVLAGLYFAEDDGAPQCRPDGEIAAFTETGSHVIHVCGSRFAKFGPKIRTGEILLIHELLHALGLGENPPTSAQITRMVATRCG